MRDLAIIDTTQRMLEHLQKFDSICMLGVGFDLQNYYAGLEYRKNSRLI